MALISLRSAPVWALAGSEARAAWRRPLAPALVALFALSIALSPGYTFFAFGAEAKLVRDAGLAGVRLAGLLLAAALGSGLVLGDVDQKALAPTLAAPVTRAEVLLGRFLGVAAALALSQGALTATLAATVLATEGRLDPGILGAAYLALLEGLVVAALSVALSVVLPLAANLLATFAAFGLGHLWPWLEQVSPVGAGGVVLPALAQFDVQGALPAGRPVAAGYLALATASAACYVALYLTVGIGLFSRREVV